MPDQSRQPTLGFLLTPPGMGALAVIRVCGPDAVTAVAGLFEPVSHSSRQAPDPGQPERLWYGRWVVNGEAVDEVIVCAGTGLDGHPQVDINAHGGIRVVERILMALQARGVELGDAAEAARRSWPARNRIEAEAIAALSQAKTRRAVDFLIHQQRVLPA
jgi:tRNA modification GTPase